MAQLAIKGHKTRGNEVIEILEMFGGNNPHEYIADIDSFVFYIGCETRNIYYDWLHNFDDENVIILSLEEFLEKFPYKVGDKVQHKGATSCGSVFEVEKMRWEDEEVKYVVCDLYWKNCKSTATAKDLQPYEEETMEERKYADLRLDVDQDDKLATEATIDGGKITPPKNYLIGKITKVDNGMIVEFVKKQSEYPKTYAECCEALNIPFIGDIFYGGNWIYGREYLDRHLDIIRNFQKLKTCRDAYWKMAGEQMGLGKPWKPDWLNTNTQKYCIYYVGVEIKKQPMLEVHHFLAFPTAEMRDAFYENFKELIEECKELL